jgi:hypothetical protein
MLAITKSREPITKSAELSLRSWATLLSASSCAWWCRIR